MKKQTNTETADLAGNQPESAIIQDAIHELAEALTEDVFNKLREAANVKKEWENAIHNPTHFLEKHGIELPEGVEFRLLDAANIAGEPYSISPSICPQGLVPIYLEERTRSCTKAILVTKTIHDPRLEGGQTDIYETRICIEWRNLITGRWFCVFPRVQAM